MCLNSHNPGPLPLFMTFFAFSAFVASIPANLWTVVAALLTAAFVFAGVWLKACINGKALVAATIVKAEADKEAAVTVQQIKSDGEKEAAIAVARIKAQSDKAVALIKTGAHEVRGLALVA